MTGDAGVQCVGAPLGDEGAIVVAGVWLVFGTGNHRFRRGVRDNRHQGRIGEIDAEG